MPPYLEDSGLAISAALVDDMVGAWLVVYGVIGVVGLEGALLQFPTDFKFGAATAAYQIEGAWNVSDKSASVWDVYTHKQKQNTADGSNGDVACDSYHQWERDIEMAEELGLNFYRFSIAWTRICPQGVCHNVSADGVAYYNKLIDGLLAKGIEPVVTMFHFDLPQRLQNLGGWANPHLVNWFTSYARVLYSLFADRVKTWITINEPLIICDGVYNDLLAPNLKDPEVGMYLCSKHLLLAHAKAWRLYDKEFRPKYHGEVSIGSYLIWYESQYKEDAHLTALVMELSVGRYSHPIYSKEGGWPPALEKLIIEKSQKEGYRRSRLPPFTKEEIDLVRGTYDFFGFNHYTSRVVRKARAGDEVGAWPMMGSTELGAMFGARPEWNKTQIPWLTLYPEGVRHLLVWLKQQYGDLKFRVMENGMPVGSTSLKDPERIEYMKNYLTQILTAIKKDKVDVRAYTAWSLMDNFEWRDGYNTKFGLYSVNFTDPHRTRTPRDSARFYADLTKFRVIHTPCHENKTISYAWVMLAAIAIIITTVFGYKCYTYNKKKKVYDSVPLQNVDNIKS